MTYANFASTLAVTVSLFAMFGDIGDGLTRGATADPLYIMREKQLALSRAVAICLPVNPTDKQRLDCTTAVYGAKTPS